MTAQHISHPLTTSRKHHSPQLHLHDPTDDHIFSPSTMILTKKTQEKYIIQPNQHVLNLVYNFSSIYNQPTTTSYTFNHNHITTNGCNSPQTMQHHKLCKSKASRCFCFFILLQINPTVTD